MEYNIDKQIEGYRTAIKKYNELLETNGEGIASGGITRTQAISEYRQLLDVAIKRKAELEAIHEERSRVLYGGGQRRKTKRRKTKRRKTKRSKTKGRKN